MGQLLSQPITEKNITLVQHDHISHSIGEMQGYRLTMEDAYCDLNASVVLDIQLQDLLKQNENKLRHQQYGDDNSINEEDDDDDDDDGIEKAASSISDSETDITEDKDLANTSTSNITTTSSSTVPTTATNTVLTTNDVNQNRTHSNDEHDTSTVIENLRRIISNSSIDSSSSSLQDNHHQQNDHNSKQRHHHHLHSVLNPLSHHSKNNHNNPIRRSEDSINSGKPKIRINIYGVFDGHGELIL
ncbi:unnamed protein product [[Candida] boidinii]|nr:unnamed protein product [[Candida] boidinii]